MLRLDYMIGILRLAYMTVVKELPSRAGFFLTKIEKTQVGKNCPNSITQDNLSQKNSMNR